LIAFIGIATSSFILVRLLKQWAQKHQLLDIPNERSSHQTPTPRGGGLVIATLTLTFWLIYGITQTSSPLSVLVVYALASSLIACTGWLDDIRTLSARVRFAAQFGAGFLIIIFIGDWQEIDAPFMGQVHLGIIGIATAVLWIVGLTNAYNFMDGINGIAGTQALIAGLGWIILLWGDISTESTLAKALGFIVAASSLGFLIHNWSPASIFMGDVGSAFLGFTFAFIPLLLGQGQYAIAGIIIVYPFVFDTLFTFLRRLRKRENVFAAHRSHLYQRLVISGYSHQSVTLLYGGLAVTGVIAARLWISQDDVVRTGTLIGLVFACSGLWMFVRRSEKRKTGLEAALVN
jgi:UDP-N-acetylmuramyl pentapeptide phosphotransferase/UDP-N-acetylglucosamine-1-phosphate transferase